MKAAALIKKGCGTNGGQLTWPSMLSIFLSSSQCIYENLALEECLFRNHDLNERGDALLIWRNSPAVVIGRFQNPWLESNVAYCQANGIRLARRFSGGGAVYQDNGNINVSILTSQARHSRKRNLEIVANSLNSQLPLISTSRILANSRDDLCIEPTGSKISGTAARIAHGRAYHHFTILANANIDGLRYALNSPIKVIFADKIETNASRSVRAKSVGCLADKISIKMSSKALTETVENCALEAFKQQYEKSAVVHWDGSFDGFLSLKEILKNLRSEEWVFGKTPKFSLKLLDKHMEDLRTISVENGRILESTNREFPVGKAFHHAFLFSKYSELFV